MNQKLINIFLRERGLMEKSMRQMADFLDIPYSVYRNLETKGIIPMKHFEGIMNKIGYNIDLVPRKLVSGEKAEEKKRGFMSIILGKFFKKMNKIFLLTILSLLFYSLYTNCNTKRIDWNTQPSAYFQIDRSERDKDLIDIASYVNRNNIKGIQTTLDVIPLLKTREVYTKAIIPIYPPSKEVYMNVPKYLLFPKNKCYLEDCGRLQREIEGKEIVYENKEYILVINK